MYNTTFNLLCIDNKEALTKDSQVQYLINPNPVKKMKNKKKISISTFRWLANLYTRL